MVMEVSCPPLCGAVPLAHVCAHTHALPTPAHRGARWHRRGLTPPQLSVVPVAAGLGQCRVRR